MNIVLFLSVPVVLRSPKCLLSYYPKEQAHHRVFLAANVRATVRKHLDNVPHLLAAHVLSGSDITAASIGVGNTVLKVPRTKADLSVVDETNAETIADHHASS